MRVREWMNEQKENEKERERWSTHCRSDIHELKQRSKQTGYGYINEIRTKFILKKKMKIFIQQWPRRAHAQFQFDGNFSALNCLDLIDQILEQPTICQTKMSHTILLVQASPKPESRTYSDYESVNDCLEGKSKVLFGGSRWLGALKKISPALLRCMQDVRRASEASESQLAIDHLRHQPFVWFRRPAHRFELPCVSRLDWSSAVGLGGHFTNTFNGGVVSFMWQFGQQLVHLCATQQGVDQGEDLCPLAQTSWQMMRWRATDRPPSHNSGHFSRTLPFLSSF